MGEPIQWLNNRTMKNFIGTSQEQLIQQASNYDSYCVSIKYCNALRRQFNTESDQWVNAFNQNKTSENLVRILDILPEKFVELRKALLNMHGPMNTYCVSKHWWATMPVYLEQESRHMYGLSLKAQAAKKKYLLLTNPTPEIARSVRYLDPSFYAEYLKQCQCPSLTVNDWEFRKPFLKPVSQTEFAFLQSSILIPK